jgi:proliferating cell nuclear antigen
MTSSINDNLLFHLFTSKTKPIKDMIELLHELLPEVNLKCCQDGVRVFNVAKDHTQVVYLKLFGDQFEQYHCPEPISLGVSMENLFKIVKLVESDETLRFYVTKDDPLVLCIQRYNVKDEIRNTKFLQLIDVEDDDAYYPNITIKSIIKFPSVRFQRLCKEIKSFTDQIQIKSNNDILYFEDSSSTRNVRQEICIKPSNDRDKDGIIVESSENTIYEGIFNLKPLSDFSKCAPLSPYIKIFLENDKPLILECNICTFGEIRLVIMPIIPNDE